MTKQRKIIQKPCEIYFHLKSRVTREIRDAHNIKNLLALKQEIQDRKRNLTFECKQKLMEMKQIDKKHNK